MTSSFFSVSIIFIRIILLSWWTAMPPGFISVRSNHASVRKKKSLFSVTLLLHWWIVHKQTVPAHGRKEEWNRSVLPPRNRVNERVASNKSFLKQKRSWIIHTVTLLTYLHGRIHSFLFHFWFYQWTPSLHFSETLQSNAEPQGRLWKRQLKPTLGQSQEEMYKQNDASAIEPITYTAERRNNVSFIWKHAWSYPNLFSVIKEHQQGLKTF